MHSHSIVIVLCYIVACQYAAEEVHTTEMRIPLQTLENFCTVDPSKALECMRIHRSGMMQATEGQGHHPSLLQACAFKEPAHCWQCLKQQQMTQVHSMMPQHVKLTVSSHLSCLAGILHQFQA